MLVFNLIILHGDYRVTRFLYGCRKRLKDPKVRPNIISTSFGRTTCSFFMPNGKQILYGSTHEGGGHACPPVPEMGKKYLWAIYETFDIYVADLKGKVKKQLTNSPGYDAEATVSPDGKKSFLPALAMVIWIYTRWILTAKM